MNTPQLINLTTVTVRGERLNAIEIPVFLPTAAPSWSSTRRSTSANTWQAALGRWALLRPGDGEVCPRVASRQAALD